MKIEITQAIKEAQDGLKNNLIALLQRDDVFISFIDYIDLDASDNEHQKLIVKYFIDAEIEVLP